jgi:hypothetical protein
MERVGCKESDGGCLEDVYPVSLRGEVEPGVSTTFEVQTVVCQCSKADMEVIQLKFEKMCPERREFIHDMVLRLVAAGLDARRVEDTVNDELRRIMPQILQERVERASAIWDPETRDGVVPVTDFDERLITELEEADKVKEDATAAERRFHQAKMEADEAQKKAVEAKARLDAARATTGQTKVIRQKDPMPVQQDGPRVRESEKKKSGLFGGLVSPVRRFLDT